MAVHKLKLVKRRQWPDVRRVLSDVQADAKTGNVSGVAIAVVRPDGTVNTVFSDSEQAGALMGAVGLLHHRLMNAVEAED